MIEKRVHTRIKYPTTFEINQYINEKGNLVFLERYVLFQVENISQGGILASCDTWFPDNSFLTFTLYLENIPYVTMCRILRKVRFGQFWKFGLEFVSIQNMLYEHLKKMTEEKNKYALYINY